MKSIILEGVKFKLKGEVELLGKTIDFKAKNKDNSDFQLSDYKTKKVISTFPKLNTSICDNQTAWVSKNAAKYSNLLFISITMDDVKTINKWCAAHDVDNITILSDKEYCEFGDKTNLVIPKIHMLARGFIVLDENNKVEKFIYNDHLDADPDFEALEDALK